MTVEAIKKAIGGLPEEDRVSLAAWLNLQTMDDWDKQMQSDFSPRGRGSKFLEQVKKEITEGKVRPLEEGLEQRRRKRP